MWRPSMRVAKRASAVTQAAGTAWELSDLAARMALTDPDVLQLTVGDVDRDTPAAVIDAAVASLRSGRTHYAPIAGDPEFRTAVAQTCTERLGRMVTRDQVVVFPGAQCALFSVLQCLAEQGDEVILLEPSYTTYEAAVIASGARAIPVSLRSSDGFELDLERLERAMTDRCRVVLLNSPNNPCGLVIPEGTLRRLVELCRRRGVWIVADEVYSRLTFEQPHVSPLSLPGGEDCTVVIDSLSKSHAMTGWRIGWALAPESLAAHLIGLAQAELFSTPPFIQDAAVVALRREHGMSQNLRDMFRRRRDALLHGLSGCPGLRIFVPEGGMFVLASVEELGMRSPEFAQQLLAQEKVAVIAGTAFGASVADTVRIGLTLPEQRLLEAARRICCFAERKILIPGGKSENI